jgi:hypothetical protein
VEGVFLLLLLQDRTDSQHTVECTPCSLAINMSHKMFSSIHYKHTAKTFLPLQKILIFAGYIILSHFIKILELQRYQKL